MQHTDQDREDIEVVNRCEESDEFQQISTKSSRRKD